MARVQLYRELLFGASGERLSEAYAEEILSFEVAPGSEDREVHAIRMDLGDGREILVDILSDRLEISARGFRTHEEAEERIYFVGLLRG